jgi:hypothetical protein
MKRYTKADIAAENGVSLRTVDNWVRRGLLPPPVKLGTAQQSRVRWDEAARAELDRNLHQLNAAPREPVVLPEQADASPLTRRARRKVPTPRAHMRSRGPHRGTRPAA